MQLTKKELAETQMIVTTPEKWDVITRKGGDVRFAPVHVQGWCLADFHHAEQQWLLIGTAAGHLTLSLQRIVCLYKAVGPKS